MITLIQPRVTLPSPPEHLKRSACNLEIWWMTLKNNRAYLLYIIKLYASFQSHRWIQTGVTVRKCSIQVKIGDFLSRVNLKFDGWPWKPIRHLFYTTSSFVHHFKSIDGVKLELQSGKAQLESKLVIFLSRVTLKFDEWPWKTTGHLFYTALSFVHHIKAMGEFKLELQSVTLNSGQNRLFCRVTLKFDGWPWKTIGHPF